MKIVIDRKNKAIIATGCCNWKSIKSICLCNDEDEFNEEFGTQLVKKKWNLKHTMYRQKELDKAIRSLKRYINRLENNKQTLCGKQILQQDDILKFCENYFKKGEK